MRTEKGIYVFEFKYKSTAKAAIKQCRECNYAAGFTDDPRLVYYVGVNYSPSSGPFAVAENGIGRPSHYLAAGVVHPRLDMPYSACR